MEEGWILKGNQVNRSLGKWVLTRLHKTFGKKFAECVLTESWTGEHRTLVTNTLLIGGSSLLDQTYWMFLPLLVSRFFFYSISCHLPDVCNKSEASHYSVLLNILLVCRGHLNTKNHAGKYGVLLAPLSEQGHENRQTFPLLHVRVTVLVVIRWGVEMWTFRTGSTQNVPSRPACIM